MNNKGAISVIDKLAFMCTHCFDVCTINVPDIEYDSNQMRFESYSNRFKPKHCPCCGMRNSMIYIDKDIVRHIQSLNKKGYITTFCCAGHLDGGCATEAYVVFNNHNNYIDVDTLPDSWYFDEDTTQDLVIRAKLHGEKFPYTEDVISEADIVTWFDEHFTVLDELMDWISTLPQNKDYNGIDVHHIDFSHKRHMSLFMFQNRIYGVLDGKYLCKAALDSYHDVASAELILDNPELTKAIVSELNAWCTRKEMTTKFIKSYSILLKDLQIVETEEGTNNDECK